MKKIIIFTFIMALVLSSCASKDAKFDDYNLSDVAWLEKIISHIKDDNLEKADNAYVSLYSEHINSPLLANAMLILSSAHAKEHEYLLANYYIDEYIKLYRTSDNYEWLSYLKIKNNFNAFALPKRNQYLLLQTLNEIDEFIKDFPHSQYIPYINTIKTKLELTKYALDLEIKDLYERIGKKESAKIYDEKILENYLNGINYVRPKLPWYREVFENSYF